MKIGATLTFALSISTVWLYDPIAPCPICFLQKNKTLQPMSIHPKYIMFLDTSFWNPFESFGLHPCMDVTFYTIKFTKESGRIR